ncbi:MAG: TonB-dependent receptor [Salinivirgaceae bacterium]
MHRVFILLLFIKALSVNAQQAVKISGYVRDAVTREALIGAYIVNSDYSKVAASNEYGFFTLELASNQRQLHCSYVGYQPVTLVLTNRSDTLIQVLLNQNTTLDEVVVEASRTNRRFTGLETLSAKTVKALPVIMGESDITRTLTLLPGVSFGNENSMGYYVRGGSADQNLLLMDGAPVYNPYHLYGFFSVFNTDAINNATLYKGGIPAKHGTRLASVLDIQMKEGNAQRFSGNLSTGMVASKFLLEGPILKDRTSFLISGRRSMMDIYPTFVSSILTDLGGLETTAKDIYLRDYYFYDLNVKVNHRFSDKDKLFVSYYQSNDVYNRDNPQVNKLDNKTWGNKTASLRWTHLFHTQLFGALTAYHTQYNYKSTYGSYFADSVGRTENSQSFKTGLIESSAKLDFDYAKNKHHFKFGSQYTHQQMYPEVSRVLKENFVSTQRLDTTIGEATRTHTGILYLDDEITINKSFTVNAGLRFSGHFTEGKFYPAILSRLAMSYQWMNGFLVKGSFSRMTQYIHVLSDNWSGSPSDLWVPSTKEIHPEISNQWVAGFEYNFGENYSVEVEGFYKTMNHLIDFKEGTSFLSQRTNWEDKVTHGEGAAQGLEFQIKKEQGKLTGFLSYTLSKSERTFAELNQGKTFLFSFDRPHEISISAVYHINNKWNLGANWVYASGQPFTLAESFTVINLEGKQYFKNYSDINNYRLPNYHRLDLSFNYNKQFKHWAYGLNLGVYNAYNRKNTYYLSDSPEGLANITLFGILPYVSVSINF